MINALLILFTISILYLSISNRLMTHLKILAIQGLILFGVAFIELIEINSINLVLILLETIVVKAVAIPMFLGHVIKKNNVTRETEPYLSNFFSLVIVTVILIVTFIAAGSIKVIGLNKMYFIVAVTALFSGLYLIVSRKKIITHIIGYVVIENGVFILSLAVGNEMPMLVNLGILLDVFVSVFLLGVFVNKVGDIVKDVDISQLSNLKD